MVNDVVIAFKDAFAELRGLYSFHNIVICRIRTFCRDASEPVGLFLIIKFYRVIRAGISCGTALIAVIGRAFGSVFARKICKRTERLHIFALSADEPLQNIHVVAAFLEYHA